MQTNPLNVSATLNVFKLFVNPSLCLPHHTISNFNQLPIPLSKAFSSGDKGKEPDIRAVVLDKDNCFAVPQENVVYKEYEVRNTISSRSFSKNSSSIATCTCDLVSFFSHVLYWSCLKIFYLYPY